VTAEATVLRIDRLPAGTVHAVGAAGLETASMVRYLVESGREDIVLHDLSSDLRAAFQLAHRFQPADHRARAWAALGRCRELHTGADHLRGIEDAAAVLVPVSWFLHERNAPLAALQERFVGYPDACFDLWRGPVIGVSGSFGKSTTARFAATLAGGVFCGNDRESFSDLGALAQEPADRCLAFEASNRHLRNGFRRRLDVGVLTGITLNHEQDHGSFAAYRQVKYSLADRCRRLLFHADIPRQHSDARHLSQVGVPFGPGGSWDLRDDLVRGVVGEGGMPGAVSGEGGMRGVAGGTAIRCRLPGLDRLSALDRMNALAAAAAVLTLGVDPEQVSRRAPALPRAVPLYRQAVRVVAGREFINDAAACVPASAQALARAMARPFVLICGGDRQRYRPGEFDGLADALAGNSHARLACTTGPMAGPLEEAFARAGFGAVVRCTDLDQAVRRALQVPDVTVVFSPGCGTGALFTDKYARGEAFDHAVSVAVACGQRLVPASQARV